MGEESSGRDEGGERGRRGVGEMREERGGGEEWER